MADGFRVWPPRVELAGRNTCGQPVGALISFKLAHSLSFLLLSLLDGTLRGPFAALRGAHPTSGSASRFELASVGRGTVLE